MCVVGSISDYLERQKFSQTLYVQRTELAIKGRVSPNSLLEDYLHF